MSLRSLFLLPLSWALLCMRATVIGLTVLWPVTFLPLDLALRRASGWVTRLRQPEP
jgi:hypothetical protein